MPNRFLYLARHGEAVDEGDLTARGRQQARALGRRLAAVPLSAVHHGPLPRATHTAELVGRELSGVPLHSSPVVGDYVPPLPDLGALPEPYAQFLGSVSPAERAAGARLAAAAVERFATPATVETHELIVTHNFLIAWLVRHALDAPNARWLGLNAANCALTVILYRPDRPAALVAYNDVSHLPPDQRWTGLPPYAGVLT
ncbi:histidine phosphatase family protein [Micromonospora sp. NPDC005189]|uniref:histidine phosphatase family protein n=1 Tax=unclassified Micromonospora TaxID=2617518 RepID=UPI0033A72295